MKQVFFKKIICIAQTAMQQGCQILLGPNIPKREKYTKWLQTDINYSEWR
jgi:hypothetical protein